MKCINDKNPSFRYMEKIHKICIRKRFSYYSHFTDFADLLTSFFPTYFARQLCEVFDFVFFSSFWNMYDASLQSHIIIFLWIKITMSLSSIYYISHFSYIQSTLEEKLRTKWKTHKLLNKKILLNQIFSVTIFIKNKRNSIILVKKIHENYTQTTGLKEWKYLQCFVFIFFNVFNSESNSSTCSSVLNVLDFKQQVSCKPKHLLEFY